MTILLLLALASGGAHAAEFSLREALSASEASSPYLRAARAREEQARAAAALSRSPLYPTLEAQGVQSYGFPGSNGALGSAGIMSSPYRSGPAAGLVSQLDLFNARSYYGMALADKELLAAQARTQLARYRVDLSAAQAYLDAARHRGAWRLWTELAERVASVVQDVRRFVRTGQHSPVDLLLVEDQLTDARTTAAAFEARHRAALRGLSFLVRRDAASIDCPAAYALSEGDADVFQAGPVPLAVAAAAEWEAAKTGVLERRAQNYPRLTALGSVGAMDKARLVPKSDYSAGIGLSMPLFEGFRFSRETERAKRFADERQFESEAAQLEIDQESSRLDEVIDASRIKLSAYREELSSADAAFIQAKRRYLSFEGPLVDVREALRNLGRIRSAQNDASADILLALTAKSLLLGGVLGPAPAGRP